MKIHILISLLVFVLLVSSCSDDGITPQKNKIKVLALLDLSGNFSLYGEETKKGIDLFIADYPDANIEITYLDTKGDAATAVTEFNTATSDTSIKAVITLASWISNAVAPIAKEKNILHYAVGSAVFDYPTNGNTVRFTGDVKDEATYLINYLKDFQKIGLMYLDNDYGKGWNTMLSADLGSKLVLKKSYPATDTNFTSILQEMKSSQPDIIVLISTKEAVQICSQAKSIGLMTKFLGNRTILTDFLLQENSADGLIFSYPDLNENYAPYPEYVTKYNRKPSSFSAEGYDVLTSLYGLTNIKGFDKITVYNSYKNLTLYGMFSELVFDENAQAKSKYKLMKITNGNYSEYK